MDRRKRPREGDALQNVAFIPRRRLDTYNIEQSRKRPGPAFSVEQASPAKRLKSNETQALCTTLALYQSPQELRAQVVEASDPGLASLKDCMQRLGRKYQESTTQVVRSPLPLEIPQFRYQGGVIDLRESQMEEETCCDEDMLDK